jgi:hypothetical protein
LQVATGWPSPFNSIDLLCVEMGAGAGCFRNPIPPAPAFIWPHERSLEDRALAIQIPTFWYTGEARAQLGCGGRFVRVCIESGWLTEGIDCSKSPINGRWLIFEPGMAKLRKRWETRRGR